MVWMTDLVGGRLFLWSELIFFWLFANFNGIAKNLGVPGFPTSFWRLWFKSEQQKENLRKIMNPILLIRSYFIL